MNDPGPLFEIDVRHTTGRFILEVRSRFESRVTGVFGPTGSGKTTLLSLIAGLLPGGRGRILFRDRVFLDTAAKLHVPPERRGAGVVFQDNRLFPHLNAGDNIVFGGAGPAGPRDAEVREVVAALGLEPLLDARPHELSGGEKKRVAVARALLRRPDFLLLDEPFAALDEKRRDQTVEFLNTWCDRRALPTLVISHDPRDLTDMAEDVLVLNDGRTVYHGPCADYFPARR